MVGADRIDIVLLAGASLLPLQGARGYLDRRRSQLLRLSAFRPLYSSSPLAAVLGVSPDIDQPGSTIIPLSWPFYRHLVLQHPSGPYQFLFRVERRRSKTRLLYG